MQELTLDEFYQAAQNAIPVTNNGSACPPVQIGLPMKMKRTDNKTQVIYKGKPLGLEEDDLQISD